MLINEKILVCYLITKYDDQDTLIDFINNYKKFTSGHKHDLLICFKLLDVEQINLYKKSLINIAYIEYIDKSPKNDFDLGSYKRISGDYLNRYIFFLNSHSYPISHNWLKKIITNYEDNSILATSSSCGSLFSSLKLKKVHKIFSFFLKKIKYKKLFNQFPNPHIRTTGFLIKGSQFFSYMNNKTLQSKEDAWKIESGKNSLTNHFKNLNFKIYVINSDGIKFLENEWHLSKTYNYLEQDKSIISDKHTRKYLKLNEFEKKIFQNNTWGL